MKFHTWLYTITLNICRNKLKRRGIVRFISLDKPVQTQDDEVNLEIPDKNATPEELLLKKEEDKKLNKLINSLSSKYRDIFVLKHAQNLSYEEISRITGLPKRTVEVRLYRAHKKLLEIAEFQKG